MMDKLEVYKTVVFDHVHEFDPNMEFIYRYRPNTKRHVIFALESYAYHVTLYIENNLEGDTEYHFFVNPYIHQFTLLENKLQLLGFIKDLYP